jgi:CheY-like chemotaxis protein
MTEERPRVLIIEDEPDMNSLEADILTAYGFEPIRASDAEQALRVLAERRPSAILLDLMLPGMSGLELCRRLKTDRATHSIPIVICSALDAAAERRMGYEAGADDYLSKPFTPEALAARVQGCLEERQPLDRLEVAYNLTASLDDVKAVNLIASYLYGRTGLATPQIEGLRSGLLALSEAAGRWAALHRGASPVHLTVDLDRERMTLTFRPTGTSDAFLPEHLDAEAAVPSRLTDAGIIDRISRTDAGVVFEKSLPPASPAA